MSMRRRGFSLVELAIVLAISGAMLGFLLKMADVSSTQDCYATTKVQLNTVRDAIERFALANDRFPMPARRNVGVDSPSYGREAVEADLDTVSGAVFGALPFQALGIPVTNAADCWGNKLTYVVTKDLTESEKFLLAATPGSVKINVDNATSFLADAGYAVVSHGADQLGAVKNNYNASVNDLTSRKWCTADPTQIRTQNCDVSDNVLVAAQFNDGKDAGANFFDDLVIYRGSPWRNVLDNCECPSDAEPVPDLFTVSPIGPRCDQ